MVSEVMQQKLNNKEFMDSFIKATIDELAESMVKEGYEQFRMSQSQIV